MPALRKELSKITDYPAHLAACWQEHLAPRAANAPTVISTFAGGGGSTLGYSMAGFRELLAVEWDDNAVATLRLNFPDLKIYHGDIAKLSVEQCLDMAGIQPGELDVFDGSPPCQGFSTAGKRNFDDDRNQLFREYVRLLRGLRPKVFVMENVSGMVKGKMKIIFAEIMRELKASGYNVSARLLNAMWFGVPQSRERMIFVGVRDDFEVEPVHPAPTMDVVQLRNIIPMAEACRSQKINPWINSRRAAATVCKTGAGYEILTTSGVRRPSHIEIRAISSYPGDFIMAGDDNDKWERIGNSVPPLFMRAIARHIRAEILDRLPVLVE